MERSETSLRRKRINIWMFFSPVVGKNNKAKCDTCGNEYSFSGGSTSNLSLHIRAKHPSLVDALPRSKRQRTSTSVTTASDITVTSAVERTRDSVISVDSTANTSTASAATPTPYKKQTSLTTFVHCPASVSRQKRITALLLKMIVRDFQPFPLSKMRDSENLFVHLIRRTCFLPDIYCPKSCSSASTGRQLIP